MDRRSTDDVQTGKPLGPVPIRLLQYLNIYLIISTKASSTQIASADIDNLDTHHRILCSDWRHPQNLPVLSARDTYRV
jgi:hypothetical protein